MEKPSKNTNQKSDLDAKIGREQYIVIGQVQGVGFRPFISNLAEDLGLSGFVENTQDGVLFQIQGSINTLKLFKKRFREELPPLARIKKIDTKLLQPNEDKNEQAFQIIKTKEQEKSSHSIFIGADIAHCKDCRQEMLDKNNRRYLYPFINCTNCGPRYSITQELPYDRANTTMKDFPLCPTCYAEYTNSRDRRFHAQPTACHECGIQVWCDDKKTDWEKLLEKINKTGTKHLFNTDKNQNKENTFHALQTTIERLKQGKIIAIKGVSGFHLACDARNTEALTRLREKKERPHKAFALMVPNIEIAQKFVYLDKVEMGLLTSLKRPIVLCKAKKSDLPLHLINPDTNTLGIMLPSSPLHELLFCGEHFNRHIFDILVMTSGNAAHTPIAIDNKQALITLQPIADHFLLHNRIIAHRADDSVLMAKPSSLHKLDTFTDEKDALPFIMIRRARGYVPEALEFTQQHPDQKNILAFGSDLKATVCITKQGHAFLGSHIGDMASVATQNAADNDIRTISSLLAVQATVLVNDLHPNTFMLPYAKNYFKTLKTNNIQIKNFSCNSHEPHSCDIEESLEEIHTNQNDLKKQDQLKKRLGPIYNGKRGHILVQHHLAHAYALLADKKISKPTNVLVLDGSGYGLDSAIWGGEMLRVNPLSRDWTRLAHFNYVRQIGGDASVKQPWLMTESYLQSSSFAQTNKDILKTFPYNSVVSQKKIDFAHEMWHREKGSLTSSCGRLFDAVAAMLGCAHKITYEGQAAMQLESMQDMRYGEYDIITHSYTCGRNRLFTQELFDNCLKKLIYLRKEYEKNERYQVMQSQFPEIEQDKAFRRINAKVARYFHLSLAFSLAHWSDFLLDNCIKDNQVDAQNKRQRYLGLTGGVFVNKTLVDILCNALEDLGVHPLIHQNYSPTDASISLGQAYNAYQLFVKPKNTDNSSRVCAQNSSENDFENSFYEEEANKNHYSAYGQYNPHEINENNKDDE